MSKHEKTAVLVGMFLAIGVGMGSALGAAFDDLGLWLPIGVALGATLGMATYLVQRAEPEDEEVEDP